MISRPGLEALQSYSAGIPEADFDIKMDNNERPANLPAEVRLKVLEALAGVEFHRYPDMTTKGLRTKIAAAYGAMPDQVLIGNGSSQLLEAMCYAFGGAGRSIVYPVPSFSMYATYVKLSDSVAVPVPLEQDFSLSPDKVLAAARDSQASLILLCNPNNPTGTAMKAADIETIVSGASCPVVVDEAYMEFYGQSALSLLPTYPNLIIARTFSKAYGLASTRVGYLLAAPALTGLIGKVLLPYHMNALSLAVAEVVFDCREAFVPGMEKTVSERKRLAHQLQRWPDVVVFPSETNFLLVSSPLAGDLAAFLAGRSIAIRDYSQAAGRLAGCLRISVGTEEENNQLLQAVTDCFEVRP